MLRKQTRASLWQFLLICLFFIFLQYANGFDVRAAAAQGASRIRDQEWTVTDSSHHSVILIVGILIPLVLLIVLFWIRYKQAKRAQESRPVYCSQLPYASNPSPVQLWMPSPRQAIPIQTLSEEREWSQCKMMPPPPPPYSNHRPSPL